MREHVLCEKRERGGVRDDVVRGQQHRGATRGRVSEVHPQQRRRAREIEGIVQSCEQSVLLADLHSEAPDVGDGLEAAACGEGDTQRSALLQRRLNARGEAARVHARGQLREVAHVVRSGSWVHRVRRPEQTLLLRERHLVTGGEGPIVERRQRRSESLCNRRLGGTLVAQKVQHRRVHRVGVEQSGNRQADSSCRSHLLRDVHRRERIKSSSHQLVVEFQLGHFQDGASHGEHNLVYCLLGHQRVAHSTTLGDAQRRRLLSRFGFEQSGNRQADSVQRQAKHAGCGHSERVEQLAGEPSLCGCTAVRTRHRETRTRRHAWLCGGNRAHRCHQR